MNDINDTMSRSNAEGEVIYALKLQLYSSLQYSLKHIKINYHQKLKKQTIFEAVR